MTIDTLKVARRLREAGFNEPQADALVAAVQEGAETADVATKRDLAEAVAQLRSEMREMELRLKLEIETAARHTESRLNNTILGALGVNFVAMPGAMFGLAKLLGH